MIYKDIILKGTLIKRYKRFFADIKVKDKILTSYCPNTGSLKGLLGEGNEVLIAKVSNPKAKLKYRLEAIKSNEVFVGINTSLPNFMISEAILNKKLFKKFEGTLRREVKYGTNSKIDNLVQRSDINNFKIAKDIDTEYYKNSLIAKKNGVKFMAYSCNINEQGIEILKEIKIIDD